MSSRVQVVGTCSDRPSAVEVARSPANTKLGASFDFASLTLRMRIGRIVLITKPANPIAIRIRVRRRPVSWTFFMVLDLNRRRPYRARYPLQYGEAITIVVS